MKKFASHLTLRCVGLLWLAMVLTGCTTVGNGRMTVLDAESAQQLLVPGKTTKAEVQKNLGEGRSISFHSGSEVWVYQYFEGLPKFLDHLPVVGTVTSLTERPGRELRILFDERGKVVKYLLLQFSRP
jgi:hypothetical protein